MIALILLAQLATAPAPVPVVTAGTGQTRTLADIAGQLDAKRKAGLGKPAFFSAAESTAPREPGLSSAGLLAGSPDYVLGDDGHITLGSAPTAVNWWQYGYGGGTRSYYYREPSHVHESTSHASSGRGSGHASGGHASPKKQ